HHHSSSLSPLFSSLTTLRPPRSTLFPYTTLFRSRVVAPFDGVITQRNIDVGSLVQADAANGTFMFTIMKSNVIRTQVFVPQDKRSEEHTSELQSLTNLVCRLLLEKKNTQTLTHIT